MDQHTVPITVIILKRKKKRNVNFLRLVIIMIFFPLKQSRNFEKVRYDQVSRGFSSYETILCFTLWLMVCAIFYCMYGVRSKSCHYNNLWSDDIFLSIKYLFGWINTNDSFDFYLICCGVKLQIAMVTGIYV